MKNNSVKILTFYLLLFYLFILIILLISGFSYSKYKTEQTKVISGGVAKPIFIIQKDDTKVIDSTYNLNNYEYNFSIKNYENDICSDVSIAYQIVVDVGDANSFAYKLLDENGKEVELSNNKSSTFILDNHIKTKQSYKLVISKQGEEFETGRIKINVEGNQILNG